MTAFLCAALEGHCDIVLYLLECGASLEDCNQVFSSSSFH